MAAKKKKKKAGPGLRVTLIAAPANSKKKVYDVCVTLDKGNIMSCGVVLAANETEAKKLCRGLAKKMLSL